MEWIKFYHWFFSFSPVAALRELKEECSLDLQGDFPGVCEQVKREPYKIFPVGKKVVFVCHLSEQQWVSLRMFDLVDRRSIWWTMKLVFWGMRLASVTARVSCVLRSSLGRCRRKCSIALDCLKSTPSCGPHEKRRCRWCSSRSDVCLSEKLSPIQEWGTIIFIC